MSFSVNQTLQDIRAEIARLQRLEKALVEAAGSDAAPQPQARVSPAGMAVIKAAARLRHARLKLKGDSKNAELKAAVAEAEKELTSAKDAMARLKAERRKS
jgi:hypothetical protein